MGEGEEKKVQNMWIGGRNVGTCMQRTYELEKGKSEARNGLCNTWAKGEEEEIDEEDRGKRKERGRRRKKRYE